MTSCWIISSLALIMYITVFLRSRSGNSPVPNLKRWLVGRVSKYSQKLTMSLEAFSHASMEDREGGS